MPMKKRANYRKSDFGMFLQKHRLIRGVTLEQLSEGLCSVSELARIESGSRPAEKALRDRLIYRLGIGPDTYECFLFEEDYVHWKKRQQLVYTLSRGELQEARKMLTEYGETYGKGPEGDVNGRLERQFVLSMEAQLLRSMGDREGHGQDALREQLRILYRKALELTAEPAVSGSVKGKVYSVQELDLLLEWIHYEGPEDWKERYREILYLVEGSGWDRVNYAKIYPKTVYYLCRDGLRLDKWGLEERTRAMVLCGKSVQGLQEAGRLYYLWELLTLMKGFGQDMAAGQRAVGAVRKAEALEEQIAQRQEWINALEVVYEKAGVSVETKDSCWMYVEKEVYCINEIIRIRRKMFGLTRKQLCEDGGICSEKTLTRLEKGGKKVQKEVMAALMKRLNLSPEYCRTELETGDPEAVELMDQLRNHIREWETEEADQVLEELKKRISLDIPSNRQEWQSCWAINELHKGTITKEQCVELLREALNCTIPYEIAMAPGEKYLTNQEINCIQNMVSWTEGMDEEKRRKIAILEERYEDCEREKMIFCFINMYEMVMDTVASELGDIGEYDKSDEISRKIIAECLYQRRSHGVHKALYNMKWNDDQRQKKGIPLQRQYDPEEELKHCVAFSELGMDRHNEEFYRRKLQLQKEG